MALDTPSDRAWVVLGIPALVVCYLVMPEYTILGLLGACVPAGVLLLTRWIRTGQWSAPADD